MDMSNFRPELHIAQQSRRDKLRIPQDIWSNHNLEQIPTHHNLTYESAGNICYDPSEFCSEMINFSANPHGILKDAGVMGHRHQEREASFHHFSRDNPMTTSTVAGAAAFTSSATHDPQYFSSDWVPNHSSIFVGEAGISSSNRISMPSSSDGKPNYPGYQELSHNNSSGEMNVNSSVYQNALQELVTSSNNPRSVSLEFASLRQKSWGETGHGSWVVGGSELLLLPAYADQMRLKTHSDMTTRPVDGCSQWIGGDRDFRMAGNDNSRTQGLSLSLSSVPSPKVHETHVAEKDFQTRDVCGRSTNVQETRISKLELSPNPNLSTGGSRILGTHPPLTHRNPGPLGPFTGYATILRNSKFLRPAQLLLEEFCCIARPKDIEICDVPDKIFEEVRVSREAAASNIEPAVKGADGNAVVSSLMFDGLSDRCREPGGMSCSVPEGYRPENLQKKAKLLYMQDEVCKKYKQYHQQMQLVVSSFESVAGLTAATPFVSLALKMIVKHFRSLKNAITDQLKSMKNALGEESSSPSAGTSGSKGDATNVSMLKFFDQSFQKQKGAGILESQHIWRPQRGLPERAVSILRAWLFDHFLHPYPTDTDKHMLATQTGLTRNQVSNWFINARVRVWKPMVEEIHMLETKAMQAETGSDTNAAGKTAVEKGRQGDGSSSEPLSRLRMRAASDKQQVECLRVEQEADRLDASIWNQDKRSRIEYHVPGSVDGTLMGLVPSHRSGIEIGGMGSVSLTLGLRQSAENAQRPPMQQERHPIPHFGGQIIRDYVG